MAKMRISVGFSEEEVKNIKVLLKYLTPLALFFRGLELCFSNTLNVLGYRPIDIGDK